MPSKPRGKILFDGCTTHKVWRGHNKEYILESDEVKETYLSDLSYSQGKPYLKTSTLNAICLMNNHAHEIYSVDLVTDFSNAMRIHHSKFGLYYNKANKRSGKVAEARPYTTCFETEDHSMDAVFYVHANPLRAGMVKRAELYKWSTHNLFAYGRKPKFLEGIVFKFPSWYLKLGRTFAERQKRYRILFKRYLDKNKVIVKHYSKLLFDGSGFWMFAMEEGVKAYLKERRKMRLEFIKQNST